MKIMRVFVAESDRDVRISLQMLLDREPGMQVVGIAVGPDDLVRQVRAAQPDIVLLDWQLIPTAPDEIITILHSLASQPQIIVLHIYPETASVAKDGGADHFISKDEPPDKLCAILQKIKQEKNTETLTRERNKA